MQRPPSSWDVVTKTLKHQQCDCHSTASLESSEHSPTCGKWGGRTSCLASWKPRKHSRDFKPTEGYLTLGWHGTV